MKSFFALFLTVDFCLGASLVCVLPSCDRSESSASEEVKNKAPKPRIQKQQPPTALSEPQQQALVADLTEAAAPIPDPNPAPVEPLEERPFTMAEARQIVAAAGRSAVDPRRDVAERDRYLKVLTRQMSSPDHAVVQAALETVVGQRKIWPVELQQRDDFLELSFFYRWGFIVGKGKSQQSKEYVQFVDLVVSHEQKFPELVAQAFFILTDGAVRYDPMTNGLEHLVIPGMRFNQPGMTVQEFWKQTPLYSWR